MTDERIDAASTDIHDAPRYATVWAAAVYAVAALALAYPALAGQFLVAPHSDQYIAGYAFREFAASHLRETGGFPLWNPYLFGGLPYVAAMHGDIFYPTFLLRMVMPTDAAMTWGFVVHVVLAGVFTYRFLRALGFGFGSALIGGLAYMLGGQVASLVSPGHDGKLFVSALFPLALLLLTRWVRDGRGWAPPVLALVVGLAVLSPHPQLLQYFLLAAGAYALFLAVRHARAGELTRRDAAIRLGVALAAVALGGVIGAIQYLPVREYVAWSPRAGGIRDYAIATSYAWPPEELLDVYLPQFSGILDAYWGRNGIHLHSQYVGASVLVLMFAAFIGWRRDARRGEILFWTGTLVVALLWALGGHTPFYKIPYAIVPGTKFFRAPQTVFFVGTLAIAYLVAVGTDRLLARRITRNYLIGWGAFAIVVALLATVGGLTAVAESFARDETASFVELNRTATTVGAWRSLLFVGATVAIALAYTRGRTSAKIATWALAAVVAGDLWSVMRHYWKFSPPAHELFATDATIDYIRSQRQPGRVLAIPLAATQLERDANLVGDGLMSHRIRTTLGYHGNQLARYNAIAGKDENYSQIGNHAFWRLTNTRWLLTNVDSVPVPGATRVAGPTTTSAGTRVSLFDLPGEQPYAWATTIIVKAEDEAVLATVLDPRFDMRTAALFDTSARVVGVEQVTALPTPIPIDVQVRDYAPGRVTLQLDGAAPAGSALVVSENFYPGWTATADGRPAAIGRANYTLIGVELPAGARTVELRFASAAYQRGKMVTLIAIAGLVLWLAAATVAGRRRRTVA